MGKAVKGTNPHACEGIRHQRLYTAAHFSCGFIGKGHSENRIGGCLLGFEQPGDPVHKHSCLAAPGTGQYQQVLRRIRYCVSLLIVE